MGADVVGHVLDDFCRQTLGQKVRQMPVHVVDVYSVDRLHGQDRANFRQVLRRIFSQGIHPEEEFQHAQDLPHARGFCFDPQMICFLVVRLLQDGGGDAGRPVDFQDIVIRIDLGQTGYGTRDFSNKRCGYPRHGHESGPLRSSGDLKALGVQPPFSLPPVFRPKSGHIFGRQRLIDGNGGGFG